MPLANEYDKIVSENIRHFRKLRGMSQEELGNELEVTFQQVQKYETNANRISAGKLKKASILLSVELDKFYNVPEMVVPKENENQWYSLIRRLVKIEDPEAVVIISAMINKFQPNNKKIVN